MRVQTTNPQTHTLARNLYIALFVSLLGSGLVFGWTSQAQADPPLLMIDGFTAEEDFLNPGTYILEGYVTANDPASLTVTITGAVTGSATPDFLGFFRLSLSGGPGAVTATTTENAETASAETELTSI